MTGHREDCGDFAHLWAWEPLSPKDVLAIMRGFRPPWWVCGGSALDLFIGRETRRHDDLDVAVLRRDQAPAALTLAPLGLALCDARTHARIVGWQLACPSHPRHLGAAFHRSARCLGM